MPNININDYNVIGENEFKSVLYDTAIVTTSEFNPSNPSFENVSVLCATTGDVTISSTYDINNLAEDVNNIHGMPIEMMQLSNRQHTCSFTAVGVTAETVKLALAASTTGTDGAIVPKSYISTTDFPSTALWIIATRLDGGMFVVKFERYLNTNGFQLTTSKAGKGQLAITLQGYNSIADMNASPVTFYPIAGT